MTRYFYDLNLLAKLMVLVCQVLINLVIAATARVILMQISAEQCYL